MITVIQDKLNKIVIPCVNNTSGTYTFKWSEDNCDEQALKRDFNFDGIVCNCTLHGTIEHDCDDRTKLNIDVGTYYVELYKDSQYIDDVILYVYSN